MLRAGLLTAVRPPTLEEEAVRDLCRARDDARKDRQQCRHRLGKLACAAACITRTQLDAHRWWIARLAWNPRRRAGRWRSAAWTMPTVGNYDVAPDGRFLIAHGARQQCTAPITLLTNWNPEGKKQSPCR